MQELFIDRLSELSPVTKASFTDCRSVRMELMDTLAFLAQPTQSLVVTNSQITLGELVSYFGPDDWEDPQIRIPEATAGLRRWTSRGLSKERAVGAPTPATSRPAGFPSLLRWRTAPCAISHNELHAVWRSSA